MNHTVFNVALDSFGLHVFDENWQYISLTSYTGYQFVVVNESFYLTTENTVTMIDINANVRLTYPYCSSNRGITYDDKAQTIIAADYGGLAIRIFDLNLNLLNFIQLNFNPHGISVYNSQIFVSAWATNQVYVFENGMMTNIITTNCASGAITALWIDAFGYMAIPCCSDGIVYLYYINGLYMDKFISVPNPFSAMIDSKGRLIINSVTDSIFIFS